MSNTNLIQNDAEWLKWRTDGIGGSDVPIILNLSPYSTRKKLLMEKAKRITKAKVDNMILNLGHQAEKVQRELLLLNMGLMLYDITEIETPVLEHPQYKFLRASLDGYLPEKNGQKAYVWEHKLVGKKKFALVENGQCTDDFYVQIQHQLFIANCDQALLQATLFEWGKVSYKKTALVEIRADKKLQEKNLILLKEFWEEVLEKRRELGIK